MLTYSFPKDMPDSLYEHLYKSIRNDILNGALPAGTKLPSKRAFAGHLGVSSLTVENAYSQLIAEGYLYSLPRKGYYVAEIHNRELRSAARSFSEEPSFPEIPESGEEEASSWFADFSSNQTDPALFPFSVWARLTREILSGKQERLMTNAPCGGVWPLRKAIASYLKEFRDLDVAPEQIIIGAGTEYLYGLLIQLLGYDRVYAIENPGYKKIARIYQSCHVDYYPVEVDSSGLRVDRLEESGADIVHISPAHHFPTGITMPVSRRYELLGWAAKDSHRYIIEDDYDSEFRLVGKTVPALLNIDVMNKVIYMNTFNKSLASTIRISYMALPRPLLKRFYDELGFYSCPVSNFEQYTLARFIEDGYFEKHINRARKHYHDKRDQLLRAIRKSPLSSMTEIIEENSGLHFLVRFKTDLPNTAIVDLAREAGICLSPLADYYFDESHSDERVFVINYSNVKTDRFEEAIHRLQDLPRTVIL